MIWQTHHWGCAHTLLRSPVLPCALLRSQWRARSRARDEELARMLVRDALLRSPVLPCACSPSPVSSLFMDAPRNIKCQSGPLMEVPPTWTPTRRRPGDGQFRQRSIDECVLLLRSSETSSASAMHAPFPTLLPRLLPQAILRQQNGRSMRSMHVPQTYHHRKEQCMRRRCGPSHILRAVVMLGSGRSRCNECTTGHRSESSSLGT